MYPSRACALVCMHHPLCSTLATGQMVAVPPCYLSLHILSGIHGLVRVVQGEQYRGHPKQVTECGDGGVKEARH